MMEYCKKCILPNTRPNITLDENGICNASTIDQKEKIDWKKGVAQITPASELHSHHNRGSKRMTSFVVQDEGLHFYLRTPGFSWD